MAETLDSIPNSPKRCDREADIAIRALTAGQLRNLFHVAATVLPEGHPLKLRIRAIADDINAGTESTVGQALAPEVKDTAIAVWQAIEGQKRQRGVRMPESSKSIGPSGWPGWGSFCHVGRFRKAI